MSDKDIIIKKKSKKMKKLLKKLKRKSIDLNVNTLQEKNNDIILKKKNIIQEINDNKRYVDEYFEQFGNSIKNLSTKLTQIEEYYDKFSYEKNISKIDNFSDTSKSTARTEISKYKNEYLDFINSIDYLTNDDSIIFNNNSGIHKKLEDMLSTFVKFKTILSDDKNLALEILFNNSNSQRVDIISQIDNYIEKIKTNIYKDLIDLKENLIKFKSSLKNYYNKFESQFEKFESQISSSSSYNYSSSFSSSLDYQNTNRKETQAAIKFLKENLKENNEENFGNSKWSDLINKINKTNINSKYESFKITLKELFNLYNKIHQSIDNNSYTDIISYKNEDGNDIKYDNVNETDNIFNKIWDKYLTSKKENNKINDEIEKDFYNSVKTNDLDPEKVLEINQNDKIIFIILIFVIRQISLIIVEYMIDNNNIRSFFYMLLLYLIFYITILIIFIIIVNIDVYKLRILFNYLNFHINSNGIMIHIILLILFTIILYYYLYNIDNKLKESKNEDLYEIEKIEYKYKLEIITLIIFVFTSIINYLI